MPFDFLDNAEEEGYEKAPRFSNPKYGMIFLENKKQYEEFVSYYARKIVVRASRYILETLKENYIKKYAYMSHEDFQKRDAIQRENIKKREQEKARERAKEYLSEKAKNKSDYIYNESGYAIESERIRNWSSRRPTRRKLTTHERKKFMRDYEEKRYDRTWEFLNSWFASRPKKNTDGGYSVPIRYYPVRTMKEYPEKWAHYSNIEEWKGSSKFTLADILNKEGSTSHLLWNYRSVAYWDEFKKNFNKIASAATKKAIEDYASGGITKNLPPPKALSL